jgi:CheY-like chemotaxis protein
MTDCGNPIYTVLVVDDDPSVLATYRRLLSRCGYRAVAQDDPLRALEAADEAAAADVLLLDHRMPGLDGLSLLEKLRERRCRARCVLVSAYVNDDVRQRARRLGVDRVLEKPVDVGLLREVLAELLPGSAG